MSKHFLKSYAQTNHLTSMHLVSRVKTAVLPMKGNVRPGYMGNIDDNNKVMYTGNKTFTRDIENAHGRLAMLGIVGVATVERYTSMPLPIQLAKELGVDLSNITAFVALVTFFFVLKSIGPLDVSEAPEEIDTLSAPGFTLETEILHGRVAMLGFAYLVAAEVCKSHPLF